MNIFQNILPYGVFGKSRAINAENPTGEKGKGGMASSNLGKGRKGSPCLKNIEPGSTTVLADISCLLYTSWYCIFENFRNKPWLPECDPAGTSSGFSLSAMACNTRCV